MQKPKQTSATAFGWSKLQKTKYLRKKKNDDQRPGGRQLNRFVKEICGVILV